MHSASSSVSSLLLSSSRCSTGSAAVEIANGILSFDNKGPVTRGTAACTHLSRVNVPSAVPRLPCAARLLCERVMIRAGEALSALEARDQRDAHSALTYREALSRIEALWAEARALNPDIGRDWREDLVA